jgi:hypothetical protein
MYVPATTPRSGASFSNAALADERDFWIQCPDLVRRRFWRRQQMSAEHVKETAHSLRPKNVSDLAAQRQLPARPRSREDRHDVNVVFTRECVGDVDSELAAGEHDDSKRAGVRRRRKRDHLAFSTDRRT